MTAFCGAMLINDDMTALACRNVVFSALSIEFCMYNEIHFHSVIASRISMVVLRLLLPICLRTKENMSMSLIHLQSFITDFDLATKSKQG
jgi:hypothetical protein